MESPTSSPSPADAAPPRPARWTWLWVAAGVLGVLMALGGEEYLMQIPVNLLFGWSWFARDNVIAAQLNWLLIAEGVLCTIALGVGGHYFMRWLWAGWQARWTAASLGALLLLFVAGIATIGITHQTAWIFTDKGPFIETSSYSDRARLSEAILAGGEARTAVKEYFLKTGKLPETAKEAGFERADTSRYVKGIDISKGVITVEVEESLGGGAIILVPVVNANDLSFTCGGTMSQRKLPGSCRDPR